jgi:glycosyltransferase A (GT-A) superfamily protein (DUF2064 family)
MNSIAVLTFASLQHSVRKFPRVGSRAGRNVFVALTLRVTKLGRQAFGDDVFLSIPADEVHEFEGVPCHFLTQVGADFGERLYRSIEQVFQLGYEQVLVVGNDSPQLDLQILKECQESFKTASVVLGPDHRGGVYLLGVGRNNFQLLSGIGWNRNSDFAQLQAEYRRQEQTVAILDTRSDLDSPADLERILRGLRCGGANEILCLLRRLQTLLPENLRLTPDPDVILRILRNIRILNQLPPPLVTNQPV